MVSKLVIGALHSSVAYQFKDLNERNATLQKPARSETEGAYNRHQKFVVLKLSRLTELNQVKLTELSY